MNKGFAYYFRQAIKFSSKTIWKNKNLIKSMVYFFMSLVARLTVIFGAAIALADVRQAKISKNQQTVDISQSFSKASKKPFWTMIVASAIELLMYLGGFLLLSLVCAAIFGVGLAIAQFVDVRFFALICVIFAVPGLLIYAVYSIIMLTVFAPTAYVIDSNPELSAGEVVSVCVSSMKSRGKTTVFMCVFVPMLIIGAIAGVFGGGYAVITLLFMGSKMFVPAMLLWSILTALVLALTAPTFLMTANTSLVLLFEDIALDPVNSRKRTAGINIKRITGAKVDREEVADNLDALFDEGIDEAAPAGQELVRSRKKVKKQYAQPAAQAETPMPEQEAPADVTFEEIDEYPEDAPKPQEQVAQPQPEPDDETPEYSDGE